MFIESIGHHIFAIFKATFSNGLQHTRVGRTANSYLHQLCAVTGGSLEDLPLVMDYKDGCREREREREREHDLMMMMCHHHHHHHVPPARISLTLSRLFSLSFIASGRSSGLYPVSSQSCCMYVRAGCPAFARPYVGVHKSTSLMSSSLLLQQCPACLVRLT